MKAHLAKVSLALLSVAFLLGCQDMGSEPVGPEGLEIQAKKEGKGKGGGSGGRDTKFTVTFSGDLTGGGQLFGVHGGKKGLQTKFEEFGDLTLSSTFLGKITDANDCFGTPPAGPFQAIMQVGLKTPKDTENATMGFWFTANGTDGSVGTNYVLFVDGMITDAEWPDVDGTTSTIEGKTFTLGHSSGSGSEVACTGAGMVEVTILVTRTTS